MEQYTWELWDYASPINGCLPQDTGFIEQSGVYLIKNNEGVVALIQDEKYRPYRELTIEECAQKQVDDMNSIALQQTEESKHIKQEVEN